jgi:hypothetical protein
MRSILTTLIGAVAVL